MSAHSATPRRAFVTGATGFLGYEIARQLVARGATVRALTRTGKLPGELGAIGVEPVRGDLDDAGALERGLSGADAVFHVAASVSMWRKQWDDSARVNVTGTRAVVEAALAAGVTRFVHTSSASTIGKPAAVQAGRAAELGDTSA